jgi:nicotinate-nucleotide pyrophosphorylase (carboxylating)
MHKAITDIRSIIPHTTKIEVEVESLEALKEALDLGVDIIMLDNMTNDMLRAAVAINQGKVILEASGNMTLDRIVDVAKTGVNIISVGALTHSVQALDISLKFLHE